MKQFATALFAITLVLSSIAQAQTTGTITGKVIDAENGEALRSAPVSLVGAKKGALTDVKGKYTIKNVAPGTYTVRISYTGYTAKTIEGIVVTAGQTTNVPNVALASAVKKTEEVIVEVRRLNDNAAAVLNQRKNAAQVSDGISAEEIKKVPDADAGQALKRVSGVTLVGDKFVYVRGVSDRYNNTTLNGAALATTEPDKRSFAFDMFPTEFLQNASVSKSFTPDMPGNFAGGLVQLTTVDFPESRSFKISASNAANNNVTFRGDQFVMTPRGNGDWLGADGGLRSLPSETPATRPELDALYSAALDPSDEAAQSAAVNRLTSFARAFNSNNFRRDTNTALPNGSFTLAYSDIYDIADNDFGIIGSVFYGTGFGINSVDRIPKLADGTARIATKGQIASQSVNLGGLLNVAYKIGTNNSISFKNTFNRSSDDETFIGIGFDQGNTDSNAYFSSQFTEKALWNSQIGGEHTIDVGNMLLDWRLGYSQSNRNEPDLRRVIYRRKPQDVLDAPYEAVVSASRFGDGTVMGRFFSNLKDEIATGAFNLVLPVETSKFKAGATFSNNQRGFDARSFTINQFAGQDFDQEFLPNLSLTPDRLFVPENFGPGRFGIAEDSKLSDSYNGSEVLQAGYVMGDVPFDLSGMEVRFIGGVRLENNEIRVNSFTPNNDPINVAYRTTDWLPSANLVFRVSPNANLRAAFSQTVTRPTFREFAPFSFFNFNDIAVTQGNPTLRRALIQNYDLRFELFPEPGEVISISGFYKDFTNPIEETIFPGPSTEAVFSWSNGLPPGDTTGRNGSARNYGVELEARKHFGFVDEYWRNLLLNFNFSLVGSEVTVFQGAGSTQQDTRRMWGQSPYSLNVSLFFTEPTYRSSINVAYNRAGRRIVKIAALGQFPFAGEDPHIYEEPRDVVDISILQPVGDFDLKFAVRDLLNQQLIWRQGQDGLGIDPASGLDRSVFATNLRGTTFQLGFSYRAWNPPAVEPR